MKGSRYFDLSCSTNSPFSQINGDIPNLEDKLKTVENKTDSLFVNIFVSEVETDKFKVRGYKLFL